MENTSALRNSAPNGRHRRQITSITPGAMKKVAGAALGLIRTHVERNKTIISFSKRK
jgi:hypothetical protein